VIVMQNDKLWPYTMTDAARAGADISVPALMISAKDGEMLVESILEQQQREHVAGGAAAAAVPAAAVSGDTQSARPSSSCDVQILTRFRECVCAICQCDISLGAPVIRLPCSHVYDDECIRKWLSQRAVCPLCRLQLPTDPKVGEAERATSAADNAALQRAMFS
jgi:hypothetical protein